MDIPAATSSDASDSEGSSGTDGETRSASRHPPGQDDVDAVDDLLLVGRVGQGESGASRLVEIMVESGAAEVVAPPSFALGCRLRASTGSKQGAKSRAANGNI